MPSNTVDMPKRLPLTVLPDNRFNTTDHDSRLVNAYLERDSEGEYWICKRPGIEVSSSYNVSASSSDGLFGHGMYQWNDDLYAVTGTKFFKNGTAIGTVNEVIPSVYSFSTCLGSTPKLQLGNGKFLYNYDDSNGLVLVTDGNFPASFVRGVVYLDGTTYVLTPTSFIQGSAFNDPTTWPALNSIAVQINPETAKAIVKQLTYIVAIKATSTEVFYDAGNPVGSPLASNPGSKLNIGCVASGSICTIDGDIYWLGRGDTKRLQFVRLSNLQLSVISTTPIEKILNDLNVPTNSTDYTFYSYPVEHGGHTFYVFTYPDANAGFTIAYDIKEGMWTEWSQGNLPYMPYIASVHIPFGSGTLLQHESDGNIYLMDSIITNDVGYSIAVDVYTPNFDAGVDRRKMLTCMKFVADQVPGSSLQVRANDDDYDAKSWTNYRRVDLSVRHPTLRNCGTFYRRAYHFRHTADTTFRLKAIDLQMDVGTL